MSVYERYIMLLFSLQGDSQEVVTICIRIDLIMLKKLFFIGLLTVLTHGGKKPNIVIVYVDDMGYGDLQSYGHPTQERGAVDELAEQGIRFTQWYSSAAVCTPSRAALLTGKWACVCLYLCFSSHVCVALIVFFHC